MHGIDLGKGRGYERIPKLTTGRDFSIISVSVSPGNYLKNR